MFMRAVPRRFTWMATGAFKAIGTLIRLNAKSMHRSGGGGAVGISVPHAQASHHLIMCSDKLKKGGHVYLYAQLNLRRREASLSPVVAITPDACV